MTRLATLTPAEAGATFWDAIIIGAGPAGSVLALELARRRLRVLLVDQSQFPRGKVCGGCLNGNALAALQRLGLAKLPERLGAEPIATMQLACNSHFARITLGNNVSISRTVLDEAFIESAIQAGAAFCPGVRASMRAMLGEARRVELRGPLDSHLLRSRLVVLAHGLKAGRVSPGSRIGAGVMLTEAPQGYPQNTLIMAIARGGYIGGVHVEQGRYDIAAAFDAPFVQASSSLGRAAAVVLREAGFPAIPGLEQASWKGTPLLTRRLHRVAGERWFAVGDAAGYVEPFTGEGMAWAMNGALALAPIAARAIATGDARHFHNWNAIHARLIGRRQWQCRLLVMLLRSQWLSSGLVRMLAVCPHLAWPFVRNLSRPTLIQGISQ